MALTFPHLSNIHFNQRHAVGWDPDDVLRDALMVDLRHVISEHGPVDHVVVTGDIAFSGQSQEYGALRTWLADVYAVTCKPSGSVLVVPGNHDVNRSVASTNQM